MPWNDSSPPTRATPRWTCTRSPSPRSRPPHRDTRPAMLETQGPQYRCLPQLWIVPVHAGHVDVEFDLISVGVGDVEAVGHAVVRGTHHVHVIIPQHVQRIAKFVVTRADLESEVVHSHAPTRGERRRLGADFDE